MNIKYDFRIMLGWCVFAVKQGEQIIIFLWVLAYVANVKAVYKVVEDDVEYNSFVLAF